MIPANIFKNPKDDVEPDVATPISDTDDEYECDYIHTGTPNDVTHNVTKIPDNLFSYKAIAHTQNIHDLGEGIQNIVFVFYRVKTEGKYPFLEFGLIRDPRDYEYGFVELPRSDVDNIHGLKCITGIIQEGITAYVMYNVVSTQETSNVLMMQHPELFFVLSDDIINVGHAYKFPIEEEVRTFFNQHRDLLVLHKGDTEETIEMPVAGYVGASIKHVDNISVFGVSPSETSAPFGSGFYFTNYTNASAQAKNPVVEYINPVFNTASSQGMKVVCRFAMFLGRTKVVLNKPTDDIDTSATKKHLLSQADAQYKSKLTLRITDHDSVWKSDYDTIYIGKPELDDGCVFEEGPLWALQHYDQHMFLHYVMCL